MLVKLKLRRVELFMFIFHEIMSYVLVYRVSIVTRASIQSPYITDCYTYYGTESVLLHVLVYRLAIQLIVTRASLSAV